MLRAYFHSLLANDLGLRTLGLPVGQVFAAETVKDPAKPFVVHRWGTVQRSFRGAPSKLQSVTLWFYDGETEEDRDYSRIDDMIARTRVLMEGVEAVKLSATQGITQVEWTQDGEDGWDDVYRAIVRTSSYDIIASGR